MVKLLELVKSHDEFKNQTPSPPPAHTVPPPMSWDSPSEVAAVFEPGTAEATEIYDRVMDQVSQLFEAAAMDTISPGRLRTETAKTEEVAAELARAPHEGEALLVKALGTYPEGKGFVVPHSANVAILAAYVGLYLRLGEDRLTDTCLAGLTHDIGNVKLSSGLLYKEGPPNPQEWSELHNRPEYSREILDSLGDRYRAVAEITHQVYERLDGSGYPRGIEGKQILLEARILGAVDFFETVVHSRPYKHTSAGSVSYGLQTLIGMADQFGPDVLKALVRSVGLFPVGTYVHLSTGEIALVLRGSRVNPMRPMVEVVFDQKKRRSETRRQIDLVASPHLYVSRPLSIPDLVELQLVEAPQVANDEAVGEAVTGDESGAGFSTDTTRAPE